MRKKFYQKQYSERKVMFLNKFLQNDKIPKLSEDKQLCDMPITMKNVALHFETS